MGQRHRRCTFILRLLWAMGIWRSEYLLHHGHTFHGLCGYCWLLCCEALGVFAASNTQLHYLSNRETGEYASLLFCHLISNDAGETEGSEVVQFGLRHNVILPEVLVAKYKVNSIFIR
jgi:hypothetical protein